MLLDDSGTMRRGINKLPPSMDINYSSYLPPGNISLFFSSTPLRYSYTVKVTA